MENESDYHEVEPEFYSRKQAAAYLGVSEKWLAQTGMKIGPPRYKFGGMIRYRKTDLDNWARQQRVVD